MATQSMNRVIHGAFRRDLERFDRALTQLSDSDAARAAQIRTAWQNFDGQLVRHHTGEHDIAWPALASVGVSADVLAQMDAEHDEMVGALENARKAMGALGSAGAASTAREAVSALRGVMLAHLDHEEAVLEQVYLDNAATPEMKAMGRKFAKESPVVSGVFFAWIQDGASAEELASLKATVPAPVLVLLPLIFGRSYGRNVAPAWR